jgi:hypothetical protein
VLPIRTGSEVVPYADSKHGDADDDDDDFALHFAMALSTGYDKSGEVPASSSSGRVSTNGAASGSTTSSDHSSSPVGRGSPSLQVFTTEVNMDASCGCANIDSASAVGPGANWEV